MDPTVWDLDNHHNFFWGGSTVVEYSHRPCCPPSRRLFCRSGLEGSIFEVCCKGFDMSERLIKHAAKIY